MPYPSLFALMPSFVRGLRLIDGGDLQTLLKLLGANPANGLTAHAGGGAAAALQLTSYINEITTAGAGGTDSVALPAAIPGITVEVMNDTANSIQVFGMQANPNNGGAADVIISNTATAPAAAATGVSQAANKTAFYTCHKAGTWKQLLSN